MNLHLGCGNVILPDFVNIDIRKLDGVDLADDISTLNTIEENSADLIYCCHVLEHFGRHVYKKVLNRWFSILKSGGILRLSVPDFESICYHYQKHQDLDVLLGLLYGGQQYDKNYHMMCWDFTSISRDLESIGFVNISRYNWNYTIHKDYDDFSQAYLPHMEKETGKLMSLNVECVKP